MEFRSPEFNHGDFIPAQYTCDGEDVSPPLVICDVPESAKSLALIVDDPDAPGGTWVHWLAWNIDPRVAEIKTGEVPAGAVEGITSAGGPGYHGPCPPASRQGGPSGTHRYFFKLFALDSVLAISAHSKKKELEAAMEGHIVEKTELMGRYARG